MRGKNILWLTLATMLLSVLMVNVGQSPVTNTKLTITPTRIPDAGSLGQIGDIYQMTVNAEDVDDLWAVGFKIQFPPYVSVLVISELFEGPFLGEGWEYLGQPWTFFTYSVDVFQGTADVSILRLPIPGRTRVGASGSGVLMTFKLTVIEAGEGPINIIDSVMLNSTGSPIPHQTRNSYYYGSTASLIRVELLPGKKARVGETLTFNAKVRNDGDIPLDVFVRLDIARVEDGRRIQLRNGQNYYGGGLGEPRPYEYIYVDEFDEWYFEWDGAPENLFGEPDEAYIESDTNAAWACMFSFEDIALGGMPIADIFLQGYTQYPNGATDNVDIDTYDISPGQGYPFAWWGSLYGTPSWGWVGPRWTTDSVLTTSPWLADKAALNDVWMLLYNYHGSTTDIMRVDSVRLRVEYSTIVPVIATPMTVMPGEELELDAIVWPDMPAELVGSYEATATIEYTSEGLKWNSWASQQKSFNFVVVP